MKFEALLHGNFSSLGKAVTDWTEMIDKLESLKWDAEEVLEGRTKKADWASENATVTREFVTKTSKEFGDAYNQAVTIRNILQDTRNELISYRDELKRTISTAQEKKNLTVVPSGNGWTIQMNIHPDRAGKGVDLPEQSQADMEDLSGDIKRIVHASLKSSQEPRLKPLARGTLLIASVSLLVLSSACSNSADGQEKANEEKPKGLSATKVCDASITGQAAQDLRKLTGADTFEQTDEVKLKSVAEKLTSSSSTVRSACEIYLPDASSPAVQIDFSRRTEHPTRSSFESSNADEWIVFPIGRHARASGSGADIYFSCPAKNKDVPDLIHGNLRNSESSLSAKDTDFARISILNSVSRNLADALGCSEESQLPEKVPVSSERWTKH